MGREFRTFRIPIVITVLMVLGLGYWTWRGWRDGERHVLGRETHRAAMESEMLSSGLSTLDRNGRLGRDEIESVLADILHSSPYRFLILEQEGRRVFSIGEVPAGLTLPSREGGSLFDDMFVFRHKFRLSGGKEDVLEQAPRR